MTEYRILTNGDKYRIQFKRQWLPVWCWVRSFMGPDGPMCIAEFDHEQAKLLITKWQRQEEVDSRKWTVKE